MHVLGLYQFHCSTLRCTLNCIIYEIKWTTVFYSIMVTNPNISRLTDSQRPKASCGQVCLELLYDMSILPSHMGECLV